MSQQQNSGDSVQDNTETFHAPATRLSEAELHASVESLNDNQVVQAMLDGYPELAVILNEQRQIVACNRALLSLLGTTKAAAVVGRRLGEVLGCIHSTEQGGGCGTSEACRTCGAINAVLECQKSANATRGECRISTGSAKRPGAWDLEVVATPFILGDSKLMIFAARDIAAIKRREVLERFFFHDALNVAGGIEGLAESLEGGETFDPTTHPSRLHAMSRQLIEEIRAQRDLAAAEGGVLTTSWSTIVLSDLFDDLKAAYEAHPVARDRTIEFRVPDSGTLSLQSDRVLLHRVLGNLIKNALEASTPGGQVTVTCEHADVDNVRFTVHNTTVMPRDVQLQVFNRSFSTKGGTGRGLGTFSVRLLTSQYLGGRVEFQSAEGCGTTFVVAVPRRQTADWTPESMSPVAQHDNSGLTGRRVLLAEDGPDNQRLISFLLKKAGAEVTVKENGKLALDAALAARDEGCPFDVILMDMQMPVMEGYEATGLLRQKGYSGAIIALTAHAMASDRDKCIKAGCDDYATKPIDRKKLIAKIRMRLRDRDPEMPPPRDSHDLPYANKDAS